MSLRDLLRRPLKDLRISVTDRCNFRCRYCMPLDEYDWIEKKEILSFEEITGWCELASDWACLESASREVSLWCGATSNS